MQQVAFAQAASTYPPHIKTNWIRDNDTGFLYASDKCENAANSFSLEKKKEFVTQYLARFPYLEESLKQTGVSRRTYYWHLKFDVAFAQAIQDIKDAKMEFIESKVFEFAQRPSNFMDRIALLRAHKPELYTEKRINLSAKDIDPSALERKSQSLGLVFDTQILETEQHQQAIGTQELAPIAEPQAPTPTQPATSTQDQ